jgi:drug/metabolite transporter (DMT)-like permease
MWRLLVRHDATRVASLFYLSPPVTMLMAWAAFGDRLIPTDVIGLVVAGLGVMLVYQPGSRQTRIRILPPR